MLHRYDIFATPRKTIRKRHNKETNKNIKKDGKGEKIAANEQKGKKYT